MISACAGKWTWIQPSGDSQTLSAGAGVTFEVSVEDGVLEENDIVVWKIGDVSQKGIFAVSD